MAAQVLEIAGLHTLAEGAAGTGGQVVLLLHGYGMSPSDLAPFGKSLGTPALFLFPRGPLQVPRAGGEGYAWWHVDAARRAAALRKGPRDLADETPAGLDEARATLGRFLQEVTERFQPRGIVLGGFSQGGMLASEWTLHGAGVVHSLVLLSASRISFARWQHRQSRLRGLPVFVSHGRDDADLAFAAGERLRDFAAEAGADVTWVPFDGGHEIPLAVWRSLRAFLRGKSSSPVGPAG